MNPGERQVVRYEALAICDAFAPGGVIASPGGLLVEKFPDSLPRVLAVGDPRAVRQHEASRNAKTLELPQSVILPGFVNAHTHLDLTHIGPQPHDPTDGFVAWIDMVRSRRHAEPDAIAASVRQGTALSRAAGVVAVGDIAGAARGRPTLTPWRALRTTGLLGTSFLEFFAIGRRWERVLPLLTEALDQAVAESSDQVDKLVRLGLQPHAPNTVGLAGFRWAAEEAKRRGFPLSTHLAETIEERQFIARAEGPQRELLERLGIWNDEILRDVGHGLHPIAHLREVLSTATFAAAHVNDADDAAIETLARTRTTVVYCPRASEYFNAQSHFGPHRYRDMLAAGINVALGTDSIINLPGEAAIAPPAASAATDSAQHSGRGMSIFDEMQLLFQRDGTDPASLLAMGTVNGAAAIGLDPALFRFQAGHPVAGAAAVQLDRSSTQSSPARTDLLKVALEHGGPSRLLCDRTGYG